MRRLIESFGVLLPITLVLVVSVDGAERSRGVEGSWELVVAQNESQDGQMQTWVPSQKGRAIKVLSDSRFTVITLLDDGTFSHANGGVYEADRGTYAETVQFSSRPEWVGRKAEYSSRVEDDLWHVSGEFGGVKLIETWRRVRSPEGLGGLPLGTCVAVREVSLREGNTPGEFEDFVRNTLNPAMARLEPTLQLVVLKGDRGARNGEYIVVMNFQDASVRDYYFESPDAQEYPIFGAALGASGSAYNELFEFIDSPSYTDYQVLGGKEAIDGASVEMLGLHALKVKPGKETEFENLVLTRWVPAWREHIPGTKVLILKGERGENSSSYLMMFTLNPASLRDFFIPESGVVTDAYSQAFQPTEHLWAEMAELVDVMLGTAGSSFTDYELIR